MAIPNSLINEMATTTLTNRSGKTADNVTKSSGLLFRLSEKDHVKPAAGGQTISQELEYAENGTYTRYSGYDSLNISPSDVFTTANFNWAQAAVAVSMSGLEMLQNASKEQVIDLLEGRIKNAEKTLRNNLGTDAYSAGTADSGKQMGGLQLLCPDDPTSGTVGGIDRATWLFWRSKKFSATVDGIGAMTAVNIQTHMNRLWLQLVRNNEQPDLIPADNTYYRFYLESLTAIQRITDSKLASAGFQTLKFMGADVVLDGGYGGGCPANHMYMLNTDYIYYRPHKQRNCVPLNPDRFATNQDAMVKLIAWAGQMTLSNAFMQGVLIA